MESKRNSSDFSTHHARRKMKTIQPIQSLSGGEYFSLPEEIITEIIARLPVKSLLKFRCVCKSWLSLISSPRFIKSHLEISMEDASFTNQRIMLTILYPCFNLKHCALRSVMYEETSNGISLNYPNKHPYRAVWVVGSVNGLVCIAINEKHLFLWNPITRMSNQLPPMKLRTILGLYNIYGFGYVEGRDDYKVMGIFCAFGTRGVYESEVKVYSLRSDSWKSIGDFEGGIPLDDSGKFAAGKLHFSTTPGLGPSFQWNILSFDLENEAYGMVEQPYYGEGICDSFLGVLGGCICVLCNYRKTRADVWVMKEYGIKESWAKVVSIPYLGDPGKAVYSKPLCILPTGEILLVFDSHFVVYDPKENCLRRREISDVDEFLDADIYFESLVSPAAIGR